MVDKLNSFLRTALLLALVLVISWWTLFLRGQLTEHERDIEGRDTEISTLSQAVLDREGEIASLNENLTSKDERIGNLNSDLATRDARIANQVGRIDDLNSDVAAKQLRIAKLGKELIVAEREAQRLAAAVALLKVDHRVARLEILERLEVEENGETAVWTKVRFTELDQTGRTVGTPQEIIVAGTRVYIEALVIKFEDDYIEAGDFLRGSSVCLFQRIFGEDQSPNQGTRLEPAGTMPSVYAGDTKPDPFYEKLWAKFWEYAADPVAAKAAGVRAVHGEAPFIEGIPGMTWRVEL
ncbi:MAG: putative coiled-coil protein SlyX, partial [Planctomycetota bacterium]